MPKRIKYFVDRRILTEQFPRRLIGNFLMRGAVVLLLTAATSQQIITSGEELNLVSNIK